MFVGICVSVWWKSMKQLLPSKLDGDDCVRYSSTARVDRQRPRVEPAGTYTHTHTVCTIKMRFVYFFICILNFCFSFKQNMPNHLPVVPWHLWDKGQPLNPKRVMTRSTMHLFHQNITMLMLSLFLPLALNMPRQS